VILERLGKREWDDIHVANQAVPMTALLDALGVPHRGAPGSLSCPVHGKLEGDRKPSARLYEDDRTCWCFACSRQYTTVDVAGAIRGKGLLEACAWILAKWPVDDIRRVEILVERSAEAVRPRRVVETESLERSLLEFRGLADFAAYRSWAKDLDIFSVEIASIPVADRGEAAGYYRRRMAKALADGSLAPERVSDG
jgi:hypothetical protein